jgi:hypothetical protein
MAIETPLPGAEDARPQRLPGFPPGSTVDVRQVDDQDWQTLRALTYHATREDFEVPVQERTDFASVPRAFVWFIPLRPLYQGRHPARLPVQRRCPCRPSAGSTQTALPAGMRELGVPFLRRWIMWAAAGLGALTTWAGARVVDKLACRTVGSRCPADRAPAAAVIVITPGLLPRRAAGLDPSRWLTRSGKTSAPAKR